VEPGEGNFDTSSSSRGQGEGQRRSAYRQEESPSDMLQTWATTVNDEIHHQVRVRPYVTVMAAAAAGYVLGAGVPRWAYRWAWDVGSKALLARVIARLVDPE
jgi:hypothetical protein